MQKIFLIPLASIIVGLTGELVVDKKNKEICNENDKECGRQVEEVFSNAPFSPTSIPIQIKDLELKNCYIQGQIDENRNLYDKLLKEFKDLSEKLANQQPVTTKTFAEALQTQPPTSRKQLYKFTVLAKPKDTEENKNSTINKKKICSTIDPNKSIFKIDQIRTLNNGNVAFDLGSKSDCNKLLENLKDNVDMQDVFTFSETQRLKPRVILLNVDEDISKEDLKEKLSSQNEFLSTADYIIEDFPIRAKRGRHWVLTIEPESYHVFKG